MISENANNVMPHFIKPLRFAILPIACCLIHATASLAEEASLTEFSMPVVDGEKWSLKNNVLPLYTPDHAKLHVVCFLGTECPLARLYGPRLSQFADEFASRGVRFVGVNSNRQDSLSEVADYTKQYKLTFPVGKDYDGAVASRLSATRTPEVFVIDTTGNTLYQGRIDDQYQPGIARSKPENSDLRNAIVRILEGELPENPKTKAVGCLIGRPRQLAKSGEITFCNQVARVLKTHCAECHREGEIGPFSLTEYDEVVGWGDMILEVIEDNRMPPWHANPKYGKFVGARDMPDTDKQLLRDWVASGMAYGDARRLPPPLPSRQEWSIGTPDVTLAMRDRPFKVPADGTVEYQYFVVDPGFTEDKWIQAAEVVPGDRSVVHHAIVFVRPPDGQQMRGISWLTAYVPGQRVTEFPSGLARHVPAGSKLIFQMHYTPNGTEASDLTKIGIKMADPNSITHRVYTLIAIDQEFEIPPGKSNHRVDIGLNWLPDCGKLLGVAPHMHLRGKAFRLFGDHAQSKSSPANRVAQSKSDESKILLDVPAYDFNWQHFYAFTNPLDLADVHRLNASVWFDNSKSNPVNPDPGQHVTWGDQTWEEMAIAFFEVAEPLNKKGQRRRKTQKPKVSTELKEQRTEQREKQVQALVDAIFKRFDTDKDGLIDRDETSNAFKHYSFWEFEGNYDGKLTRAEVAEAARNRL